MEYELYHYGVPGMRWGVRRYQNKDGSLTATGKKKVSKEDKLKEKAAKKAAKKERSDDYWKLLESESLVNQTSSNVYATRRLVNETTKANNPAKMQMANTLNAIAEREHSLAKSDYVRVAQDYVKKYGSKTYLKGVVNTKHAQNGRGRVMQILSEDKAYDEFMNSLHGG